MKAQVPSAQGFALCERCFHTLQLEVKQHRSFIRKTYSGNDSTWTRGQVRYLAQVLGIDLERFKKGHRAHVTQVKENVEADGDVESVDLPTEDLASTPKDTAALFGEKFISLMEKRPDINKSIMEVLRIKLAPPAPKPAQPAPLPQYPISHTAPQAPLSPSVLPLNPLYIPNLPPHVNSTHNFNYNYFAGSGFSHTLSTTPTMYIPQPPHSPNTGNVQYIPQLHHSPRTGNVVQVNINFNMPSTSPHALATSAFLAEINNAVMTSLQRHSTLLTHSQLPPRVNVDYALNGGILARSSNQQ